LAAPLISQERLANARKCDKAMNTRHIAREMVTAR